MNETLGHTIIEINFIVFLFRKSGRVLQSLPLRRAKSSEERMQFCMDASEAFLTSEKISLLSVQNFGQNCV